MASSRLKQSFPHFSPAEVVDSQEDDEDVEDGDQDIDVHLFPEDEHEDGEGGGDILRRKRGVSFIQL